MLYEVITDPVDLDRPGDVTGVIEQEVFVGLRDADRRVVEVIGHPRGGHEHGGVSVGHLGKA